MERERDSYAGTELPPNQTTAHSTTRKDAPRRVHRDLEQARRRIQTATRELTDADKHARRRTNKSEKRLLDLHIPKKKIRQYT